MDVTSPYDGDVRLFALLQGRESERDIILQALVDLGRAAVVPYVGVCGVAGVGKTALLRHATREASVRSFAVAQVPSPSTENDGASDGACIPLAPALGEALWPVTRLLLQRRPGSTSGQRLRQSVEAARSGLKVAPRELIAAAGEAAEDVQLPIVFVADDLDRFAVSETAAMLGALVEAQHTRLPVVAVVSVSPSATAERIAVDSVRGLSRLLVIAPLDHDQLRELLRHPDDRFTVAWDEDAVGLILTLSAGYPLLARGYASHAWRLAQVEAGEGAPVTRADVEGSRAAAEASLRERFYRPRLFGLNARERRLIEAVAEHGGTQVALSVIVRRLGVGTRLGGGGEQQVLALAQPLVQRGLLYMDGLSQCTLTLPRCELFLYGDN